MTFRSQLLTLYSRSQAGCIVTAVCTMIIDAIGYTRDDVDVIELHDCFSTNELISYEALGLCPEGQYFCTVINKIIKFSSTSIFRSNSKA